jgi:hypothetical protein
MGLRTAAAVVALASAFAASAAVAAPPPQVSINSFAELSTPLPYPYDEDAKANAQVARAKAQARKAHKLVLIDLGGNWCADCRILAGTMQLPEVKRFVGRHYVVAMIDVGRFDRNLQVPAHYGIHEKLEGVPALLIVDPKTDKLLNAGDVTALDDARHMSPQALADWLAQWTK